MNLRGSLLGLLLAASLPTAAPTQQAPPPRPSPLRAPAPLLYVHFAGPEGMRIGLYPGGAAVREFPAPAQFALRPGYIYRMQLTQLPRRPGVVLFPSLEVRGSLRLPAGLRAADHPVPVVLYENDIDRALAGGVVTKVFFLERPDTAVPTATHPDIPYEYDVLPGTDPMADAREHGRPVLVLRLGAKTFTSEEIAGDTVAGTVLLPGETTLAQPAAPAPLPWYGLPFFDPRIGPVPAESEECLYDGGDAGWQAGFDARGRLHGVEPADTVAAYTDAGGARHLAVSNRVCLCVPRFVVARGETVPIGYETVAAPVGMDLVEGFGRLAHRVPPVQTVQTELLAGVRGTERPTGSVLVQQLAATLGIQIPQAYEVELGLAEASGVPGPNPAPPGKLVLRKWVDCTMARVGDVVTFYLRYTNVGGQPVTTVSVTDSLTGRLEYVPGSGKTDRPATFTTRRNEAGSDVLTWDFAGGLPPGQSGVVSFQARVR